jgi:hypothetical protein
MQRFASFSASESPVAGFTASVLAWVTIIPDGRIRAILHLAGRLETSTTSGTSSPPAIKTLSLRPAGGALTG